MNYEEMPLSVLRTEILVRGIETTGKEKKIVVIRMLKVCDNSYLLLNNILIIRISMRPQLKKGKENLQFRAKNHRYYLFVLLNM